MGEHNLGKDATATSYEPVIRQVENTVATSLTIDSSNNAVSAGPITIGASATVTVSGVWVIV